MSLRSHLTLHAVWVVQKEEEKKAGEAKQVEAAKLKSSNLDLVKEEMRKEAGLSK